jgi:hypothetical protein
LTLTFVAIDTALYAELWEARNCGHGHVHVYGLRTRPWVSGTANALGATDLDTRRPESSKRMRAVLVFMRVRFPPLRAMQTDLKKGTTILHAIQAPRT